MTVLSILICYSKIKEVCHLTHCPLMATILAAGKIKSKHSGYLCIESKECGAAQKFRYLKGHLLYQSLDFPQMCSSSQPPFSEYVVLPSCIYNHLGLVSLLLIPSYLTSNLSANFISYTLKTQPEFNHFSPALTFYPKLSHNYLLLRPL